MFGQTIVLLAGISSIERSDASSAQHIDLPGGVLPLNDSFLNDGRNFVRTYAEEMFGVLENFTIWYRPTILDASSAPCPPDWPLCESQFSNYFLQKLQLDNQNLSWAPDTPVFAHLPQVPIYRILLTHKSAFPTAACRLYGFRHAKLRICAEAIRENGRESIMLGRSLCIVF
jgi:hypothetical protein